VTLLRRHAVWLLVLIACTACSRRDAQHAWDAGAARAVARAAAAAQPQQPMVVLNAVGGPGGEELPWGVRQSLTTGGVQVADTAALHDGQTSVLIFESSTRTNAEWIVHTRLVRADGPSESTAWRVRCTNDTCDATAQP
jgi:hypothetical protein